MTKFLISIAGAAAVAALASSAAGAGMPSAGLRAAITEADLVEQVRVRYCRRYGCTWPSAYGPIIIEPSAPAPRAYYVDYRANAAYYGWYGYYIEGPTVCYGPPYYNCWR